MSIIMLIHSFNTCFDCISKFFEKLLGKHLKPLDNVHDYPFKLKIKKNGLEEKKFFLVIFLNVIETFDKVRPDL